MTGADEAASGDDRTPPDGGSGRERGESPEARRNRNWGEILQELRVVQTGVQLITAFLLALPFQSRFATLTRSQQSLYLAVVSLSILATGLLVTPVGLHRAMFRKKEKETLVIVANRLAQAGLAVFAVAVAGVAALIFDVTQGRTAGAVAGGVTLLLLGTLWAGVPAMIRSTQAEAEEQPRPR
ncbi:DUF6328 family protein [Pseudofrankia inefficax]|uniref:Sodium:proton antiporter n=1 Tax=Pseudofrankia inefficax (strain DSM 45817 / CECT 9037 / DDB 130130 / EuI1c) TaxID=298654 RepID=E3J8H3_PSEI1|nr:DUF6328 family protein [Pseudofrankia inefficax]ADP84507.1 hypothetical protein FraEuI1c_6531 [Pseudofrankia inefficax]